MDWCKGYVRNESKHVSYYKIFALWLYICSYIYAISHIVYVTAEIALMASFWPLKKQNSIYFQLKKSLTSVTN